MSYASLHRRLLRWFAENQRALPWRHDRDPYRIWVSEVMLQQTQVATVVPYFERFLAAFPTLQALAAADEQDVLRLWEGLGYYRRARDLHRAARQLVLEHNGDLPDDPDVWRGLSGVGRYMVGAILSQAFDRRLPIVEANSLRVLCRFFGQTGDPRRGPGQRWLWETAEDILPRTRVGEFNQAVMELGALVCTPAKPRCGKCPLASMCVARKQGLQETIPVPPTKPKVIEVREVAVVIRHGERVLLVQRPGTGRWARMWEFPHGALRAKEAPDDAALRLARELTSLGVEVTDEMETVRHGVTHHRITMICLGARKRNGAFRSGFYVDSRWLTPAELGPYPISAPQRLLARRLVEGSVQRNLF
ncbi:MAG: A/G-specific adenine glycosylase [Gemmataceae bacterium]|nr:A/G-specific adenine glycosylase [Gemmataceae bacterium]